MTFLANFSISKNVFLSNFAKNRCAMTPQMFLAIKNILFSGHLWALVWSCIQKVKKMKNKNTPHTRTKDMLFFFWHRGGEISYLCPLIYSFLQLTWKLKVFRKMLSNQIFHFFCQIYMCFWTWWYWFILICSQVNLRFGQRSRWW